MPGSTQPNEDELAAALRVVCAPLLGGLSVDVMPEVDSTNTRLLERAKAGDLSSAVLVGLRQTAGRGRLGRSWLGEAGASLMVSVGLVLNPRDWSGLSLASGLAIADALHPDITLKWPNDLWVDQGTNGRKLGGILIETATVSPALLLAHGHTAPARWCVLGVGINLTARTDIDLRTPSACLREMLPMADVASTAMAVLPAWVRAIKRFEAQGFAPLQARFHARCALAGVDVTLSDGVWGTVQGVDALGALVVHTQSGERRVSSDEVSVKPR